MYSIDQSVKRERNMRKWHAICLSSTTRMWSFIGKKTNLDVDLQAKLSYALAEMDSVGQRHACNNNNIKK